MFFMCNLYILVMSFTRFYDDEIRIQKQLQQQTFPGRYRINVPGQGSSMPFQEDAHVSLQQWGANLRTNTINLESDLMGLSRKIGRDHDLQKPNFVELMGITKAQKYADKLLSNALKSIEKVDTSADPLRTLAEKLTYREN